MSERLLVRKRRDETGLFNIRCYIREPHLSISYYDESPGEVVSRVLVELADLPLGVATEVWDLICELNWGESRAVHDE